MTSEPVFSQYLKSYMCSLKLKTHLKTYQDWLVPVTLLFLSVATQLLGDRGVSYLAYQGIWLQNNEFWRLLTGHFTHLGWSHLLLNAVGLIMLWALYRTLLSIRIWSMTLIICGFGISLGFTLFDPLLQSYVGLSGVLHSLMGVAIIISLHKEVKLNPHLFPWENAVMLIGLLGKIIYEQIIGPVPFTQSASGGDVVVNAHLYGTIIGISMGMLIIQLNQRVNCQRVKSNGITG